MSGVPIDVLRALMSESLAAWRVTADVAPIGDRALAIGGNKQIRIEPAPAASMFRWLVTIDGRTRPAISLLAVLRQVRGALDPGYAANRVRIAVAPLVPS
jgi:hypothetical protein